MSVSPPGTGAVRPPLVGMEVIQAFLPVPGIHQVQTSMPVSSFPPQSQERSDRVRILYVASGGVFTTQQPDPVQFP